MITNATSTSNSANTSASTGAITRDTCRARDAADPLAALRDQFALARLDAEGVIYLDGNSLGVLPKAASARVRDVVEEEWGHGLIRSWNSVGPDRAGWMTLAQRLGDKIAPLIGVGPGEVIVADSTSINLFKVLSAAIAIATADAPASSRPRRQILSERTNFPTDLYIADTLARAHGLELVLMDAPEIERRLADGARRGRRDPDHDDLAILLLTHVNYRTGRRYPMSALTRAAHAAGALVIWDLAHSAGAMPVQLYGDGAPPASADAADTADADDADDADDAAATGAAEANVAAAETAVAAGAADAADAADFAIGCGYKYLNGGPGAPAFAWVHPRHLARMDREAWRQPLSGWMGHAAPFAFVPDYQPAPGIARFLCGTPPVLSLAALECGIDTLLATNPLGGLAALREKSIALTDLFIQLVESRCAGHDLTLVTPRDADERGSQVSFAHATAGYAIMQALIARGVIGDFRDPDILRFGFTPLYTRFVDVWDAVDRLVQVLTSGEWREPRFSVRAAVT
jgi:kynureninase